MTVETTVEAWLNHATSRLKSAGIETPRLDALVLLGDVLNKNSAQVLAQASTILSSEQKQGLEVLLERRLKHEPLAYIRGYSEFYGRSFMIDKSVLIPRPETETLVELTLALPAAAQATFIDVGTGSGALAVTIAAELPKAKVRATDISQAALTIASRNAKQRHVRVTFTKADLLEGINLEPQTTVLANLPYVPNQQPLNQAAAHEPRLAIFGGPDGLDLYRRLFEQLVAKQHAGYVLAEAQPEQHPPLIKIAQGHGYKPIKQRGYGLAFGIEKTS